jgi:hypothetical protein
VDPRANLDASREEEISCYARNQTVYCRVDGLVSMRTTLPWLLMQIKFLITCGLMFLWYDVIAVQLVVIIV